MFSFLLSKATNHGILNQQADISDAAKSAPCSSGAGGGSAKLLINGKKSKSEFRGKSFLYGNKKFSSSKKHATPKDKVEKTAKLFKLDKKTVKNYFEAFRLFDKNCDGSITTAEIQTVMQSLGILPTDLELNSLIEGVDENDNGSIEFEEFVRLMVQHKNIQSDDDDIKHAFKIFDKDKDGYISSYELSDVMNSLGEKMDEREISSLIKEADKDGDGRVNFDEFQAMLKGSAE